MIESGQEAINNAIDEAKSAAEIDLREKMRSAQMANIMNYSFQGILSTDQDGIITGLRPRAPYRTQHPGFFPKSPVGGGYQKRKKASFRAAHLCLLPPDGKLRSGTG